VRLWWRSKPKPPEIHPSLIVPTNVAARGPAAQIRWMAQTMAIPYRPDEREVWWLAAEVALRPKRTVRPVFGSAYVSIRQRAQEETGRLELR
jgi:hypothetical protein